MCHLSGSLCLDTLASLKLNDNIGDNLMLGDLSLVRRRLMSVQIREARSHSDRKIMIYFLILNFRRVLIVVSFLLGKSPASVY